MRSLVSHTSKYLLAGAILIMTTSLFAGSSLYTFTLNSIDGKPAPLADYKGKVVLIVNVASQCGYTPQYSALEAIYEKYKDRGFVILGFPANNFGAGTWHERGDQDFLLSQIQRDFPHVLQNLSQRGGPGPPVQLPDKGNGQRDCRRDPMELHQVPRGSQWECGAALRARRHAGLD